MLQETAENNPEENTTSSYFGFFAKFAESIDQVGISWWSIYGLICYDYLQLCAKELKFSVGWLVYLHFHPLIKLPKSCGRMFMKF